MTVRVNKKMLNFLAIFSLAGVPTLADASLIGATVNMSAYYPTDSSLYTNPGNAVVSGAVEYPIGTYFNFNPSWEIDIGASQLVITNTDNGFPFAEGDFNGWILDVVSGPDIVAASVDSSSGFEPYALSVMNGDLWLNYQGVSFPNDTPLSSVINFTTVAVPAPATCALALLALALVGCGRPKGSHS